MDARRISCSRILRLGSRLFAAVVVCRRKVGHCPNAYLPGRKVGNSVAPSLGGAVRLPSGEIFISAAWDEQV